MSPLSHIHVLYHRALAEATLANLEARPDPANVTLEREDVFENAITLFIATINLRTRILR